MTTDAHGGGGPRGLPLPDSRWMLLAEVRQPVERHEAARLLAELGLTVPPGGGDVHMFRLVEIGGAQALVAAAAVAIDHAGGEADVVAAGVAPELQGLGVGRRLFALLLDALRGRGVATVTLTAGARHHRFIEGLGFAADEDQPPMGARRYRLAL